MGVVKHDYDSIVGQTIGKFEVLSKNEGSNPYRPSYKCRCVDCGWEGELPYGYLTKAATDMGEMCSHHIDWVHPEIGYAYNGMISRCYGKRELPPYDNITVCDEWLGYNGKLRFRDWSLSHGFKPGLSIDRIDPTKGYSPDNCQWISLTYNVKFTSTTNIIHIKSVNGYDVCDSVQGWAVRIGKYANYFDYHFPQENYATVQDRLNDITNFIVSNYNLYPYQGYETNKEFICFEVDNDRPIGYDYDEHGNLVKKE